MQPTHIVLHHSTTEDSQTFSWSAVRRHHVEVNGWSHIGYHHGIELIRDSYEIVSGQMPNDEGIHCPQNGMNHKAIAICMIGDFDKTDPPAAALELCRKLCLYYMLTFNIPVRNVTGHREHNPAKSCPGERFNLIGFRASLTEAIGGQLLIEAINKHNPCNGSLHDLRNGIMAIASHAAGIKKEVERITAATANCAGGQ